MSPFTATSPRRGRSTDKPRSGNPVPGEIMENPETTSVILSVENGEPGRLEQHESDLVILSVGMEAPVERSDQ